MPVLALLTGLLLAPALAHAGPRDDMKSAYDKALADANNLEYDAALRTLNGAIGAAESGGSQAIRSSRRCTCSAPP